ncbi:MAG: 2-hydroxyacid dehydrogenase [Candidatus Bathyarchaeia archaeon]
MERIVFAEKSVLTDDAMLILESFGEIVKCEHPEELRELARESTIILSEYTPVTREIILSAHSLKGIVAVGVGYNHIDVETANQSGVYVANAKGANAEAVAELTVALMIMLCRNVPRAENWIRARKWKTIVGTELPKWMWGNELFGKTLGIIGLGEIGRRVARICVQGFGMRALTAGTNHHVARTKLSGIEETDMGTLFSKSDVITLHVPLTEETIALVNRERLALMKSSAVLINTSRGRIVDEEALIEALKNQKIAGAALDVFSREPLPLTSPLFDFENVVLTPHIGGYSEEASTQISNVVAEEVSLIARGEKPRNLINTPI